MAKKKDEKGLVVKKEPHNYALTPTWIEEKQVLKMLQKTPKEHVYQRPGKGGQKWDYITVAYVQKVLNYVFGWNWDYEIINQQLIGDKGAEQVVTTGKLTVKDDAGHTIVKTQVGRKDVAYRKDSKIYLDIGNDYKASASDALKKCASLLGIGSDIYGKEEFKEIKQEVKQAAITVEPPKPKEPEKTPEEKALHDLFLYAWSKGATKGQEKEFIEEKIGTKVEWEKVGTKEVAVLRMQLMSKTVNRNNKDENSNKK